jgi:GNAT superfamily N-acetyltransferase
MYIPQQFDEPRIEVLHGLIRAKPLATLVVLTGEGLEANHIPLHLSLDSPLGTLRGHVARSNKVWKDYLADVEALAIFHGPETYITPSWYATKKRFGKSCADLELRCCPFVFAALATKEKGKPIGFISLYESYSLYANGAFGTIPELYVVPGYRKQGVGMALLDAAKKFGVRKGWTRIEVTTPPLPAFQQTLHFYEREGFAVSGGKKLQAGL